jgi:ribosomal protein S20
MVNDVKHLAPLGKSHHVTLSFRFSCYHYAAGPQGSRYIYDRGDYSKLRHIIGSIDWDKELSTKSVDQCWDIVEKKLKAAVKLCVPKRRVTSGRSHRKPLWMNGKALDKVRKKRQAFQRYLETQEGKEYKEYAKFRNQAKWEMKKAMKEFERKIAQEAKANPKAFFKYAQSKLKTRVSVSDLKKPDGSLTSNSFEKADTLNSFFSSVFTQEDAGNLPVFDNREYQTPLDNVNITVEEVRKKLSSLKVAKSPGPDGIYPRVLRELSVELSVPLHRIFVMCLSEGVIPQPWKDGHVSPIFKKGSRSVAGNYRPVSLTAIVCKLMEGFIRDAVLKHMTGNGLLTECQHGFVSS